jgi:hypothetical protein
MKKKLILLAILLPLAAVVMIIQLWGNKNPSQQQENLVPDEYKAEGEYALSAVRSFYTNPRQFPKFWQSRGDMFQSAVRLLKKHPMKNPEIKKIYRYKSSQNKFFVELEAEGCPNIEIGVWSAGKNYNITELNLIKSEENTDLQD